MGNFSRRVFNHLPETAAAASITIYTGLYPGRTKISMSRHQDHWMAKQLPGHSLCIPTAHAARRFRLGKDLYIDRISNKYEKSGFVEVELGDIVVDGGAFIGEFSLFASERAEAVYAIEPNPSNIKCLKHNLRDIDNIEIKEVVLWSKSGELELNIGEDPTESSLLGIDSGEMKSKITVESVTIPQFMNVNRINEIDFLKLDAEGAEPEVLSPIQSDIVNKLAVDCSAERDGVDTKQQVSELLEDTGFETVYSDGVVFAKSV